MDRQNCGNSLEKPLEIVRGEALLQTPAVEEALNDLIAKKKELRAFFERLKQEQDKLSIQNSSVP